VLTQNDRFGISCSQCYAPRRDPISRVIFASVACYGNQRRVTLETLALPIHPAAIAPYPVSSLSVDLPSNQRPCEGQMRMRYLGKVARAHQRKQRAARSTGAHQIHGVQVSQYRHGHRKVSYLSAGRLIDRTSNLPYCSVMILADGESVQSAASELKLQAGMPAEFYIDGSTQTPLQYLTAPSTATIRKAGRQM
jgi:hypothetical protein